MAISNKQRLVLSIIDFLNQSIQDGTVKQDDQEGLEVASELVVISAQRVDRSQYCSVQCIGEAFGVDPTSETQASQLSVKPATLQTIFDVFLKTRDKMAPAPTASSSAAVPTSAAPANAAPSVPEPKGPSSEDKAAAEKYKASGNSLMSTKQYDAAIEAYTKAIELDPTNAVYYSNRAAAHSSKSSHAAAITDAEKALEIDPSFVRAYHRLG